MSEVESTENSRGRGQGTPGRPQLNIAEAEALVRSEYGIEGVATPLPSDRDQNFMIQHDDGSRYILKISNSDTGRAHLEAQELAMILCEEADLPVPRVIPGASGSSLLEFSHPATGVHLVRLLSYLDGYPIALARPQPQSLLVELGECIGNLNTILAASDHAGAHRDFQWDLRVTNQTMRSHMDRITDHERNVILADVLDLYEHTAAAELQSLPHQLIHGDFNDYNVVVQLGSDGHRISGLLDFGDLVYSVRIAELAITCAYAMLEKDDPVGAACAVAAGYHSVNPISDEEIIVLYPLICARLGISVCMSAFQKEIEPDNDYLTISEQPVWELLEKLTDVHPRLAWYRLRDACGLDSFPGSSELIDWLEHHQTEFAEIIPHDSCVVFDFSVGSTQWAPNELMKPGLADSEIASRMHSSGAELGIGRYDEPRLVYTSNQFETSSGNRRTIHLGLDLFQKEGSAVHAPIDGTVHSVRDNDVSGDYGPTVILCHEPEGGPVFYTLYGHLSRNSIRELVVGARVSAGDPLATLGDFDENGGWAPHLHFQIIGDLLDSDGNFPGVAAPEERDVWKSLCPDPNLVCNISLEQFPGPEMNRDEILKLRSSLLGPSLSLSYIKPLHLVRGFMQHLYDADGRRFLDCVNNVPHVGHSNPRVVEAGARQLRTLTTNTRYLHENLVRYANRLTATMPEPLSVIFFVNSGSEANDLALRIARAHTNTRHMIVIEGAYHGNLSSLIDLSPYTYEGTGGSAAPPTTHAAIMPDTYRGKHRDPNAAIMYADHVAELVSKLNARGESANFIAESALSCGGQIFFPNGYLASVYDTIRAQGGVCIADEVQVGLGRLGSHFWGFQAESVVPDIVTIGKPVGNGHPLGAVVTTKELADSFSNGMEYFNTFGGNPVSCAIGMAVLDEIEENDLQTHALEVGTYLLERLQDLAEQHEIVGDVRGRGLFIGIELVRDGESLEPAHKEASYVVNRMLEKNILLATDGPLKNVIKIKPPLVFTEENADHVVNSLDEVLREDVVRGAFR